MTTPDLNAVMSNMQTHALSADDLNFVLRHVPSDVRRLVKENGLFIAGGIVRSVIAGEKISDIDLFGGGKETLRSLALQLAVERKGRMHASDNAFTVLTPGGRTPIQFITRWLYSPGEQDRLLAEFDFTVAKAVIWFDKAEKEWRSLIDEGFYRDLAARRLVYTFPVRNEDAGGSLMRMRKFLMRGYTIQAYSLAGVVARLTFGINQQRLEGLIAAEGREKATTAVLCSLLHEVDPLRVIDGIEIANENENILAEEEEQE